MSQEHFETIRAITDAYNRGDFDAVRGTGVEEFVVVPAGGQPPIRGADKVREWMEPDAFESQVIQLLELRDAGDKVLARTNSKVRGAGSGIEIEFAGWAVWTFNKAGRPIRVEIFLDHEKAEALEAAGLQE